jgi:hypothetical protein
MNKETPVLRSLEIIESREEERSTGIRAVLEYHRRYY